MFEIIDSRSTSLGEVTLRRRSIPGGTIVHEIQLDGALLMSSLVNLAERELAVRALCELPRPPRSVFVAGLGLGYTADSALSIAAVERVVVVELLPEVIEWHLRGLVPLGPRLTGDPRCVLVQADAFEALRTGRPAEAAGPFDAVLVDVDHTPEHLLRPEHGSFYEAEGLATARGRLKPGGVFGLWSAGPTERAFLRRLETVFPDARAHEVSFYNVLNDAEEVNTIYLARA